MTPVRSVDTPWDDPVWVEKGDNTWQRGLRAQQGWWRAQRLCAPPGPHAAGDATGLVNSTLPPDGYRDANFLTEEATASVERRLGMEGGGGLVTEDRLRRNLLSSQPLCFNFFGHLQRDPDSLLWWLRLIGCEAKAVERIEVEWAPRKEDHFQGGSAFDAFVEYRRLDDRLGFVGIECKYAEDLSKSDVKNVRDTYIDFTRRGKHWLPGAETHLNIKGLRQFWLNTLLAQSLADTDEYAEGRCVVAACAADASAKAALDTVRGHLIDPGDLTWHPYEEIVGSIRAAHQQDWKRAFIERYLDFTPVAHLLGPSDPRAQEPVTDHTALAAALAVAERVLADGSVMDQLAAVGPVPGADAVWTRLSTIVEDLKLLRVAAGDVLGDVDGSP